MNDDEKKRARARVYRRRYYLRHRERLLADFKGRRIARSLTRGPNRRQLRRSAREAQIGQAMEDPAARLRVVSLMPVACGVVKAFRAARPRHEWDDLYQEAYLGVMEAVATHPAGSGPLDSFAYLVVRRRMSKFVRGEALVAALLKLWDPSDAAELTAADDHRRRA